MALNYLTSFVVASKSSAGLTGAFDDGQLPEVEDGSGVTAQVPTSGLKLA